MWDGRFRTLEEQAVSPFQRGEMGISVNEAVSRISCDREYVRAFHVVFGTRPTPQSMARALAGYVRTLVSRLTRFDRFLVSGARTLSPIESDGWSIFNSKAACSNCHQLLRSRFGRSAEQVPLFTDFAFHNLGVASSGGRFADAGRYRVTRRQADLGAFRTPSLRNVEITAPYMHDGSLATLEEVIAFYDAGGRPNPNLSPLIRPLFLTDYEKDALVAFLRTLTDPEYEALRLHPQRVRSRPLGRRE
jgi:cytochrome c peroxidase